MASLAVVAVTGCGGGTVPTLTADGVSRSRPAAGAPVADVVRSITDLGYRLGSTALPDDANTVISPLSVAYAFAMARAGARGDTAAQIDAVFGFPAGGLADAFNAITRQIVTADTPPPPEKSRDNPKPRPPVVCVGNGMFPQKGLPIGADFLNTLAAQYGTGVHPVDFAAGKATDPINRWVGQQTAGRIKKLFDSLPETTRLVLANTVYLRADWANDLFAEGAVAPAPFTRAGGGTVPVPTMHGQDELRYAEGDGWQAVDLPYAGGQLVMRVLLPAPGKSPGALLAPATMATVAAALRPEMVAVSLPTWNFGTDLNLVPALRALGLTLPLSPGADFGGIGPDLYIDRAVHRATITVDEWGTEAAAVTGLGFATAGMAPARIRFTADRPFAFAIVHTGTGVPLFEGQVTDPSA